MASQTVNFVNPTVITTLQSQQVSNSGAIAQLQVDTFIPSRLTAAATGAVKAYLAEYYARPAGAQSAGGAGIVVGNAKAQSQYSCFTGICNSGGQAYNGDVLQFYASCGKILSGVIIAKMIEENLINPNDKVRDIIEESVAAGNVYAGGWAGTYALAWSGPITYYDPADFTVADTGAFPWPSLTSTLPDHASWTGPIKTSTLRWEDITLSDLMHFNIGIPNDVFGVPSYNMVYFNTGMKASFYDNSYTGVNGYANPNWNPFLAIQAKSYQITVGNDPTGAKAGPSQYILTAGGPVFAPFSNPSIGFYNSVYNGNMGLFGYGGSFLSYLALNKVGLCPLAYEPRKRYLASIWNTSALLGTYDTSMVFMSYPISCKLWTYYNSIGSTTPLNLCLTRYYREKLFVPLGMNSTVVYNQQNATGTTPAYAPSVPATVIADGCFVRTNWLGAPGPAGEPGYYPFAQPASFNSGYDHWDTWCSYACDPNYAALADPKPSKWSSDPVVTNDGCTRIYKVVTNSLYTGNFAVNSPGLMNAPVFSTANDMSKLFAMIANKGVIPGTQTQILKPQAFKYLVSPKASVAMGILQTISPQLGAQGIADGSMNFCLGAANIAKDLTQNTWYGFNTDTSLFWRGFAGNGYLIDYDTGNYHLATTTESFLSTSAAPIVKDKQNQNYTKSFYNFEIGSELMQRQGL
jgi:CubicO group peptidase (beta-lactamase class C family)